MTAPLTATVREYLDALDATRAGTGTTARLDRAEARLRAALAGEQVRADAERYPGTEVVRVDELRPGDRVIAPGPLSPQVHRRAVSRVLGANADDEVAVDFDGFVVAWPAYQPIRIVSRTT